MEPLRPFQLLLLLLDVQAITAVSILKTILPGSGRCAEILMATLMKLKSPHAQWQDQVMAINVLKYHMDFSQLDSAQDHRAYNSFVQKVPTEMRNGKKRI
jgi:hypothetical protein